MAGSRRIQVHGHRGARAMRPENTIAAFRYAIEAGVDALEMDLAVTKDNVLVISHDPVLKSTTAGSPLRHAERELAIGQRESRSVLRVFNKGAILRELTVAQVREGTNIPALDEVLSLSTQGSFDFNLEIKSFADKPQYTPPPEEFVQLVMEQVRKHGLEERVTLLSFDFRILIAAKKMAPEIRRSALTHFDLRAFEKIAQDGGQAQIVSPHYRLVTRKKVQAAHTAGIQVVAWTVNTPAGWDKMINAEVDAIVCDDPAALIAYLNAKFIS